MPQQGQEQISSNDQLEFDEIKKWLTRKEAEPRSLLPGIAWG
jgi:hypothetical protein